MADSTPPNAGYPVDLRAAGQVARAARSPVGDFEGLAGRVIARLTGARVVIQDDGSRPAMADIRIERPGQPDGYVEVVTDIAHAYAAMYRQVTDRDSTIQASGLTRVWSLTISSDCVVKRLRQRAGDLLTSLEASGLDLDIPTHPAIVDGPAAAGLLKLGVVEMYSREPRVSDVAPIQLLPEGTSAPYVTDWKAVSAWIASVLSSAELHDVRSKLMATGAPERHVFLGVTFSSPGEVFFALDRGKGFPPEPRLPAEVTHLWVMRATNFGGRCITWSPDEGWRDVAQHWATG